MWGATGAPSSPRAAGRRRFRERWKIAVQSAHAAAHKFLEVGFRREIALRRVPPSPREA